ncbi:Trm112 family protein [Natronospira bacteriovora]|uniref:Trm112 family protein n=1 Tax=Natronospira bacteriovora TaxID=3069753 RepID=UPI0040432A91
MSIDRNTLGLLVCPICKGELIHDRNAGELICKADRLAFPVRDGIPVMLEEEARRISLEEKDRLS